MYGQGMGEANWLCGTTGFIPGPLGMVLNMIFWVVIILLIFKISQHFFFPKKTSDVDESTPTTILKKRYAAGELTREEFNQMTDDINQDRR